MSATPKHVLFVCTGNTCRSPMAEALLRHHLGERPDIEVSSAGISASKGSTANPETISLLAKSGIAIDSFRSRQVSDSILAQATHVFAMTRSHIDILERKFPKHASKFFLLREFCGDTECDPDLPDPIGLGPKAYAEVAAILVKSIPTIVAYIESTEAP